MMMTAEVGTIIMISSVLSGVIDRSGGAGSRFSGGGRGGVHWVWVLSVPILVPVVPPAVE
jgi:hypothetical protein